MRNCDCCSVIDDILLVKNYYKTLQKVCVCMCVQNFIKKINKKPQGKGCAINVSLGDIIFHMNEVLFFVVRFFFYLTIKVI